ncbi:MAG: hypothetical protein KDA68_14530, partial [Planctomycetaceae bacterium]|nr:hypothetical protein [Planctomycetaceae bacterium]
MQYPPHHSNPNARTPFRRWLSSLIRMIPHALLFAMIAGATGCGMISLSSLESKSAEQGLPPLRPAPNAIGLRYTFVERPVGDPLLG